MAAKRSVTKSAKPSAKPSARKGVPQPHGGMLVPGAGGGPQPGSGRPPNEFKEWCKALLDDATNREQVEKILGDKDHPAFKEMWKAIADRAHGKPKEHVQLDVNEGFGVALAEARRRAKNR